MSPQIPTSPFTGNRVIDKQAVPVVITMTTGHVRGHIHVMINHRPSDVLNDGSRFLAVTDVTVTPIGGGASEQQPFIALNKDHILLVHEQ